jgi:uncharacterized membrane protein
MQRERNHSRNVNPPGIPGPETAVVSLQRMTPDSEHIPDEKMQNHLRMPQWHHHPGVRSGDRLTRGERAADKLRNGMGSWGFVFSALIFLFGWMLGNRNVGFDKYPFILLNLILSCLAAMQGAILLIAAKREDQISSELAAHDYATNVEANKIVKAIHELTQEIHEHVVQPKEPAA